jgi:hypothetical protein
VQRIKTEQPRDEKRLERQMGFHAVGVREYEPAQYKEEIEQHFGVAKKWEFSERSHYVQMIKNHEQSADAPEAIKCRKSLSRFHNATSLLVRGILIDKA